MIFWVKDEEKGREGRTALPPPPCFWAYHVPQSISAKNKNIFGGHGLSLHIQDPNLRQLDILRAFSTSSKSVVKAPSRPMVLESSPALHFADSALRIVSWVCKLIISVVAWITKNWTVERMNFICVMTALEAVDVSLYVRRAYPKVIISVAVGFFPISSVNSDRASMNLTWGFPSFDYAYCFSILSRERNSKGSGSLVRNPTRSV